MCLMCAKRAFLPIGKKTLFPVAGLPNGNGNNYAYAKAYRSRRHSARVTATGNRLQDGK